ncbi:MAG: hypothetical protein ABSG85_02700 [Spirochaetia bacterium]
MRKMAVLFALLMTAQTFAAVTTSEKATAVYSLRFTNSISERIDIVIDDDYENQLFEILPGASVLWTVTGGVHSWWGVSLFRGYEGKLDVDADSEIVIGRDNERREMRKIAVANRNGVDWKHEQVDL